MTTQVSLVTKLRQHILAKSKYNLEQIFHREISNNYGVENYKLSIAKIFITKTPYIMNMFKSFRFKKLITVTFILLASSLNAQVIKSFTQRTASNTPTTTIYNVQGDYTMIGNTNLTLESYSNSQNNSNNNMEYVDVDGDPNTFNSSSAVLEYSTENGAIPECSNVLFAGLYWTGRSSNNSSSSPEEFNVTKGSITKTFNKRKVQVKGPNQSGYTEFEANPGNIYFPNGAYGNMYSAFVEITDYVDSVGIGEYTIADLALVEGNGGGTGYYGGWGLAVVYENSQMNWRDMTVFDGHAYVQGNSNIDYELPVDGFLTAQAGPVNMKLGIMAGEGDVGISGDYFKIRNWQDNSWVDLSHSGNSATNFFNSSVETGGNIRTPNLQNNTGLDISMFNVPNPSNSVVTNGQTSTRFQYGSTQDTYVIFCIVMAVDAYIPDVEAVVNTESINGIPVGSGPITVHPGETIQYKVQIKNLGTEAVDSSKFVIPIPYITNLVSSTITTAVNFSPLPSPNNAYYDPLIGPTGSVVWKLGTLPMPPIGSSDSVLAELTFELEVTTDCYILTNPDCPPQVVLSGGTTTGIGAVSGAVFDMPFIQGYQSSGTCIGDPIFDPLILQIDAAQYITDNCGSEPSTRDFLFCNYQNSTISYDSIAASFPSGISFYNENSVTPSAIKYDENNPFPATPGTQTYFAIPDGINFCYYTFTISVQSPILTSAIQTSSESCVGSNDGAIDLIVLGGVTPLTFNWTGPLSYSASTEDINLLQDGEYHVLITDDLGCTVLDSATISTIPDVTLPTIVCPTDIVINNDSGMCGAVVTYTSPVGSDNCPNSVTVMTQGLPSGAVFPIGTTTVEFEVTDMVGNKVTCSFNVIITDSETPTISCQPTINTTVTNEECSILASNVNLGTPTTADNCGILSISNNAPTSYPLGITNVIWTVTDVNGNTKTCNQEVNVTDDQKPVITTCGGNGTQEVIADAGTCTYTNMGTAWDALATDNCSVSTLSYTLSGATTGTGTTLNSVVFNLGTTTVLWTVTDGSSNTQTCTFDVNVTDDQKPVITTCGGNGTQEVIADAGTCTYTNMGTAWDALATDNCSVSTLSYTLSGATTGTGTTLNSVVFNLGTTTVLWTVTDGSSNTQTCTFDVNVTDDQKPVITTCGGNGTQEVTTDPNECTYTVSGTGWDVLAEDNCIIANITYTLTGATNGSGTSLDGISFEQGTTTVTWTVIDGSGNFSTCTFNVVVTDNETPTIIGCPTDIIVNTDLDNCDAVVSWIPPTFSDNCGATITSTHTPGDVFTIGTTTVIYTVIDATGNSSTCSFNIDVADSELPQVNCPLNIESCTPLVTFEAPTATDNCGILSITQTAGLPSNSIFPVGTSTVTFEVIDVNGNTSTCSFDILIHPTPILTTISEDVSCFGIGDGTINLSVTNGSMPYTYSWSNNALTEDLSALQPGVYNVDVEDTFGCSASISDTIAQPNEMILSKVISNVNCYDHNDGKIDITITGGTLPYSFNWGGNIDTEDLTEIPIGEYAVTVTDHNGCQITNHSHIIQPDLINIQSTITNATCNAANGAMTTIVTGGIPPYTYLWSNGSPTEHLINYIGGDYTLTLTDSKGCIMAHSDSIGISTNLTGYIHTSDVLCYNEHTGDALAVINSGNAPYSYTWSTSDTTNFIDVLNADQYSVFIQDAFGCQLTLDADINQPDSLMVELYSPTLLDDFNISVFGGTDGSIESTVEGGSGNYIYQWSTGDNSDYITDLPQGSYNLTVTDENSCTTNAKIVLFAPRELAIPEGLSPNGDGDNDFYVIKGINVYPNNEITVFNRWGNIVYQQSGYNNEWQGTNNQGESLPDGTYFVIFQPSNSAGVEPLTGYIDLRRSK